MKVVHCPREHEVVRAVLTRRWPYGADEELHTHTATCEMCSDVLTVAAIFNDERDEELRDVHVPAAGQVWWRAALQAHNDAARAARRPMVWLQGIAGASIVPLIAAMIVVAWPSIREAAGWIATFSSQIDIDAPEVTRVIDVLRPGLPFALAMLACLVVAPVVVYFALSDD